VSAHIFKQLNSETTLLVQHIHAEMSDLGASQHSFSERWMLVLMLSARIITPILTDDQKPPVLRQRLPSKPMAANKLAHGDY
jgi:hypothetical protein